MTGRIYFETYAIPLNVGESILRLNPIIARHGFKFIKYKLEDFEKEFIGLLNLPKDFSSSHMVQIGNTGQLVTREFYQAMSDKNYFNNIFTNELGFIYILKRTKKGFYKTDGMHFSLTENSVNLSETDKFLRNLIRRLRLLDSTYIDYQCVFNKSVKDNHIMTILNRNVIKSYEERLYEIKEESVKTIGKMIKNPDLHKSCEIALESYELSYTIGRPKIKFMILMMGLESLFNLSKDQIRHTLARHLAILLSHDKSQFSDNYKRNKKLYDIRSEIAHGTNPKKLGQEILELHELTRKAITEVDKLKLTKEELFDFLNQKGFK